MPRALAPRRLAPALSALLAACSAEPTPREAFEAQVIPVLERRCASPVDPDDTARLGHLLPPKERWIVGGALPEQVVARREGGGIRVHVSYSASNELQAFAMDEGTGALTPGPVWPTTGHNPHGLSLTGDRLLVSHRLGETLGVYSAATGEPLEEIAVGDLSAGPFPATDAEIGELVNFVTAPFTVDGDQSCVHCHREGGNVDKALSMPLTRSPGVGLRMVMSYRGAADTRPWFFEASMDQSNFRPVINEFARVENFCCSDYTLFPEGAPPDCAASPPPECDAAPNPSSSDGFGVVRGGTQAAFAHPRPTAAPSRDRFFLDVSARILGRAESFGDGLYFDDLVTGERQPIPLDFDGVTRALGLFLRAQHNLLPNPNDPAAPEARRGEAIFEALETGCSACHPAPTFAVSTDNNPFGLPLRMGPVVTPVRGEGGVNLDLLSSGFLATFPISEQDSCEAVCGGDACAADAQVCDANLNVRLGVPSLRGIWDRADGKLHDGRARSLREVICTPGHPALAPGEQGYNERDGAVDTHGGTSHLSPRDVEALIAYLNTL
jgi:hypothetical protein